MHILFCMLKDTQYFWDKQWIMIFTQPLHLQMPVLDTKMCDPNPALWECFHNTYSTGKQSWNHVVFITAQILHRGKGFHFLLTFLISGISTLSPFLKHLVMAEPFESLVAQAH